MSDFFSGQMDFIYFCYGLSLLVLTVGCYYLQRNAQQTLPWQWLGWFGLTHGIYEWLDLTAVSYGDSAVLAGGRAILMAVSFILLLEFGRQGIVRLYGKGPARWVSALLILAAIAGSYYGWPGFKAGSSYALGLTGAWAAALSLWGMASSQTAHYRPWLRTGSVCLLLYGVAAGVIVSPAPFLPASLVNDATFLQLTGLPIQLLRGFLVLGVAAMAFGILFSHLTEHESIHRPRPFAVWGLAVALAAILCTGWGLTQFLGNLSRVMVMEDGADSLKLLTENFAQIFREADQIAKNLAEAPEISQTLRSADASLRQTANSTLDRYKENFGLSVCYLQDVHGQAIASSNRGDPDSFVGHSFAFRPYFQQALKGSWGHYVALGAVTGQGAYWVSYPVKDSAGKIMGVAVLRLSLSALEDKMILLHGRKHPAMITDADGVVILSNRSHLLFQTLWPVSPEVFSHISPRYNMQQARAIFPEPLANGRDLWFEGNHYLLSYKSLQAESTREWTVVDLSPYDQISDYRLVGLLVTFILIGLAVASVLWNLSTQVRTAGIERLVAERTAALATEIEERKRVEEDLQFRNVLLSTEQEVSIDGILVVDETARILSYNRRFVEMYGLPAKLLEDQVDEPVLQHVTALMADPRSFVQRVQYLYEHREETSQDELLLKDGRVIDRYSAPMFGPGGRCYGRVWYFRDITERKNLEEERLRYSKLESLGHLAGGIAHDFNNILTAILGNISLAMLEDSPGDGRQERLLRAENACQQARALAQQLLTFAKGGAPVKEVVSVAASIAESAAFACSGSQVRCESEFPENLRALEVDPGQIGQVFQNLIINAIQAMPNGGTIKISAANLSLGEVNHLSLRSGDYVKISIQDQGMGIPIEHLPKIFDPYFTTKQKGSGLGLATSYSIINHHQGHISVESKMAQGTTFHIYLPASDQKLVCALQQEKQAIPGQGRILVMDDEEMVREVLGKMLIKLGYEVKFAQDGAQAIEIYRQAREHGDAFDAVILDLTVPGGMGGKKPRRNFSRSILR